ncbi:calpain-like cysteine peptidase [Strigomonas culicis]|uniref:Calpain-like cysteine peptidase n=1 Tax=Strigomonas culicis TaxID=28005 RepID=S9W5T6_9TRYP|nr:calpain-like cysteine peptidase [Strigomonas culicis]EPY29193.1 calpain-like cysteine peptidase [Strigomonas culicis]EPY31260.1 calpain-like cysteine peptidase [Strigomonas culicis]|eukprot:EPY27651.1 calpain-like cysteine peptidase [Strigomonas culicis]
MDDISITAAGMEEVVTENMLAEFAAKDNEYYVEDEEATKSHRNINHSSSIRRLSTVLNQDSLVAEDEDEITSDDNGDFACLTEGLKDPSQYDQVRSFVAFCKQQEKDIKELEEACKAAEHEQQMLWKRALASSHVLPANRKLGGDIPVYDPKEPRMEVLDETLDEFEDIYINFARECFYMDPASADMKKDPYKYGKPDVSCDFEAVFKDGLLFKGVTDEGAWIFYNDSEKYVMNVKYQFGATSEVTAGPRAEVERLPTGEIQATVIVLPERTEVLVCGEINGHKNLSTAVLVDTGYTNTTLEQANTKVKMSLNELAIKCKKTSYSFLSEKDVLEMCRASEGVVEFIDPTFPPLYGSLYRVGIDEIFLWNLPWRRADQFVPPAEREEIRLFRGQVLPTDPFPGDGGDFYLCSAASMVAERPMKVRELFRHPVSVNAGKEDRRLNAYHVTLARGGWWETVIVDGYLPSSKKGPEFGRCENDVRKLWFPILEKAYAKLYGSYSAIQCGDPLETLQDMVGFPTSRFDEEWLAVRETQEPQYRNMLFDLLKGQVEANYMVCLSAPDEGPVRNRFTDIGLRYGMSYFVNRVVHHKDHRLLQLRCPTAKIGWQGLWCAESARWKEEPELAKLCEMVECSVVQEFMWFDWSEVFAFFEGGGACHTRFTYMDYRVAGMFTKGAANVALEIFVKRPFDAYCILSQQDDRGTTSDNPNHILMPLMLCVAHEEDKSKLQKVVAVCNVNPDETRDKLNFIIGRDVALHYTFKSSPKPYYLLPRSKDATKRYTLGFLPNVAIDNTYIQVRFVHISSVEETFRNKRELDFANKIQTIKTRFQRRTKEGYIHCGEGVCISFDDS